MLWLAQEAPETALCAAVTATAALWWPDEMVGKAANFCRWPTDLCLFLVLLQCLQCLLLNNNLSVGHTKQSQFVGPTV